MLSSDKYKVRSVQQVTLNLENCISGNRGLKKEEF